MWWRKQFENAYPSNDFLHMKVAVLQFPGSNCDRDAYRAVKGPLGLECDLVWHKQTSLAGYDAALLPGGFSYGDYLRCGAIARFSPVMEALVRFAADGRRVLGICNGFKFFASQGFFQVLLCATTT